MNRIRDEPKKREATSALADWQSWGGRWLLT